MNEFKRMQKLAGIITESQLNEDMALSNQELKAKSEATGKSIMNIYNMMSEIDDIDDLAIHDIQEIGFIISKKDWDNRDEFSTKQKIYREIQKHINDKDMVNDFNKLFDLIVGDNTEDEYYSTDRSLNENKTYNSFPEWLNAFMEEYKDEPSIIDPIKENGLDKAQTDEEFYNMVKEKGKEVGKNYAGDKSFIVYRIGKNISSVAPVNNKGKQLYFVNFGTGLSTYGSWHNSNSNIIVPSSTDQSSKIYPQGSRKD